ncbi:thiamine pyrophosphate-dependent enzyme [Pseudonocardia acaciae]|uniref:thiamine pyrophosphate-dependent enzyme n=1 Tax=Pseudonocardia acaciae TaxID=551276 RepID=UPI000A49B49A|nr:thiamine pyrophosphate-dependent enzyme [Pseudonocardia acaciae]
MTTVAHAVVDVLAEAGARRCYTVPGESFLSVIDQIAAHDRLRLISVRHESGASFMADADARLTGVPAVALASRGPGAANLAIGVHTARQDSTPMIVLLGQVDSSVRGREAFQEVDLTAFYGPITKWAVTAERAEDMPELVARGWRIATTGRPGPVAIAVPSDFSGAPLSDGAVRGSVSPTPSPTGGSAVESLASRLLDAGRPVAVLGEGARPAGAALTRMAERFGLGVCTSFRRQDAFPVDHAQFVGHLGLSVPDETFRAVHDTDLLLVIGTRLDEITTQRYRLPRAGCPVVHVGRYGAPDSENHDWLDADPVEVVDALASWPGPARAVDWRSAHAAADAWSLPDAVGQPPAGDGVHPARVVTALHAVLPPDAVVTSDAGNFSSFLHRYWRFPPTTRQLAPVNGAMGYAVPAAVAAKLAAPHRAVVAVVGDGGALMTGQEIEVAARHGAPIVVVVMQNGLYGTIAMHQARDLGRTAAVDIGAVDLVSWAAGLGAAGYQVCDAGDLHAVLRDALAQPRPAVVAVRTEPDVISPTARLDQLLARHRH